MKIGDMVQYKLFGMHYKYLGDQNPQPVTEIKTVRILASSKGTDYRGSDWIVCLPHDYPITDLRSHSRAKHWGIDKDSIIRVRLNRKEKEGDRR